MDKLNYVYVLPSISVLIYVQKLISKSIATFFQPLQVLKQCPEGTPIPSVSWVHLQFWPKNRHWHSSCHYTSKLNIRYMVQTRQLRKSHEDSHYVAALFRYQREMTIKFREYSAFICLDDKHRLFVYR